MATLQFNVLQNVLLLILLFRSCKLKAMAPFIEPIHWGCVYFLSQSCYSTHYFYYYYLKMRKWTTHWPMDLTILFDIFCLCLICRQKSRKARVHPPTHADAELSFAVPNCQKEYEKINSYTPCAIPSCFRTYGSVIPKAITLLSKKENNGGQSIVSQLDVIKSSFASEGSLLWHFSYCALARKTWWLYWKCMIHSVGNAFSSHALNNSNWENACKLIAYNFGGTFISQSQTKAVDDTWQFTCLSS